MRGLIPQDKLEQIRAASDIVEVIRSSVPLKRAGANFVALCPFHHEKTPSFNVNPHRQIFHCFGCHKGGDVFTFVREYENLSFLEAARRLAERAGIVLEFERDPGQQRAREVKETLLLIHEQITQRWQAALTHDAAGQIARDYLARRQVSPEAVQLFRLGFAPEAWDDTVNWARGKGHDPALVEQAGLIIRRDADPPHAGQPHHYDRFRGRLMFPICDEQGRVIAFSGRVLSGDEKTAKYVNSPETPIFTKGRVIFGLDKTKRALLEERSAIICEGQLDLIACFMAGVRNVAAPQGTALTADHARILRRYVEEVVLCFDADAAGQNAALRALDDLIAAGLAVRVATLPAPHDPDSFIKAHGGPAFRELLQRAENFFDFLLGRLCAQQDLGSDRGRLAVMRGMAEAVLKSDAPVLRETYARKTAARLGVAVETVWREFTRGADVRPPVATVGPAAAPPAAAVGRPPPQELWLLKLLLAEDGLAEWAAAYLEPAWIQDPLVRRVVTHRLEAHRAGTWRDVPTLVRELENPEAERLISEAAAERRELPRPADQLRDVVRGLRDQFLEREILSLKQDRERPETAEPARLAQQRRLEELIRAKRQPVGPSMSLEPGATKPPTAP